MKYNQLKLGNQLCFPLYAVSRLITREYQPHLAKLGITYPQYLVLMTLWEKDGQSVNEISQKLLLKTNTITPLLKRMESQGLIKRTKSKSDERSVIVSLTNKGNEIQEKAKEIPAKLASTFLENKIKTEHLKNLKITLEEMIKVLEKKSPPGKPGTAI